ncbi:MAG: hypothetical protein QF886_24015, partial [Planctomycetota bacterium]|nr:hypothetical protein [Planctomycetota bacterium]
QKVLEQIGKQKDIKAIRDMNIAISTQWIALVTEFQLDTKSKLHLATCDMANDGEGASWLQVSSKIANPYYGAEMLRCGDIEPLADATNDEGEEEEAEAP